MWPLIRFVIFNVVLPTTDVVTDFLGFLTLLPDHPRWASIVLTWMFTSFCVHSVLFFIKKIARNLKDQKNWGNFAIYLYRERAQLLSTKTIRKFVWEFCREAGIHLPGVNTIHNLWRAKRLHELKYGMKDFKMRNHKEVEEILAEAGRCSHGESMYEAGPQSVTQVSLNQYHGFKFISLLQLVIVLSTGQWSYVQLVSFSTSVLSLSWGASRLAFFFGGLLLLSTSDVLKS